MSTDDFNYKPQFGGGGGDNIFMNSEYLKNWDETEQEVRIRLVSPTYTRLVVKEANNGNIVNTSDWEIADFKEAIEDRDKYQVSQSFSWVVLLRQGEDKDPEAKIYEATPGVFKKIQAIANDPDWSPIHETDLKIVRKGHKKEARYDVIPLPTNRGALSDDEFAIADEILMTKFSPQSMTIKKFTETYGGADA